MSTRRKFSKAFKSKVVLEALKNRSNNRAISQKVRIATFSDQSLEIASIE